MVASHELTLAWLLAWWPSRTHADLPSSLRLMRRDPATALADGLLRPHHLRSRDLGTPQQPGPQGEVVMMICEPHRETDPNIQAARLPFGLQAPAARLGHLRPLMEAARILVFSGEMSTERFLAVHDLIWRRRMRREMAGYPEPAPRHAEELHVLLSQLAMHLRGQQADVSEMELLVSRPESRHLGLPSNSEIGLNVMRGLGPASTADLLRVAGRSGVHLSPLIGSNVKWRRWLASEASRFGNAGHARKLLEEQPGNWVLTSEPREFGSPADAELYLQQTEDLQGPLTPSALRERGQQIKDAAMTRWHHTGSVREGRNVKRGAGERGPRAPVSPERLRAHFKQLGTGGPALIKAVLKQASDRGLEVKLMARAYEIRLDGQAIAALVARKNAVCVVGTRVLKGHKPSFILPAGSEVRECARMSDYSAARWSCAVEVRHPRAEHLIAELLTFAAGHVTWHDDQWRTGQGAPTPSRPFPDEILPRAEGVA